MAGWKEQIKGKTGPTRSENGIQFTRRYVQYEGIPNSTSLPSFYTPHPESSGSENESVVRGVRIRPLNDSTLANEAIVTYSTLGGGDAQAEDISTSFSALPRRVTVGGEMFTIDTNRTDYYWLNPAGTKARADVQSRIATGTLEITEVIESSAYAPGDPTGAFQRAIRTAGKINQTTFEGLAPGNWLYNGAQFDRFINSSGALRYKVHHSFSFRLPDFDNRQDQGWRLLWREDENKWDLLTDTPGGTLSNPIPYTSGEFSDIFSAPGA